MAEDAAYRGGKTGSEGAVMSGGVTGQETSSSRGDAIAGGKASGALRSANARISELEAALNRMVCAHENIIANSEGRWPAPDRGCIECTSGTVPNHLNTGLCAFHNARKVLRHV